MIGGGLGGRGCEYLRSEVLEQMLGDVVGVVGVVASLASFDGDA